MPVFNKTNLCLAITSLLAMSQAQAFDQGSAGVALDSAVNYLDSKQHASDGGWGESERLRYVATAASVEALHAANKRGGSYYSGVAWLENHYAANTDVKARKILSLKPHGNNIAPDLADIHAAKRDPSQSGWGLSGGYVASPLESALALRALVEAGDSAATQAVIDYLVATQLSDGGWSTAEAEAADDWITAEVMLALVPHNGQTPVATALVSAAAKLQGVAATVSPQVLSRVSLALFEYHGLTPALEANISSLLASQDIDGGWGSDLATASSLRLMASLLDLDQLARSGRANIEQEALRLAINAALGAQGYAPVSNGDLAGISSLDLRNLSLKDLKGLELATGLTSIMVNASTDISALAGLGVDVLVDSDIDDIADGSDNCPSVANTDQANFDADGMGDVCDSDIDNDGMPNDWETQYAFNNFDPADAELDSDSDRFNNLEEFTASTNPKDATAVPYEIAVHGDLNGDGFSDLVLADEAAGKFNFWQMGGGTVTGNKEYSNQQNWQLVARADVNGDGKDDLVLQHKLNGSVMWWQMDGINQTATKLMTEQQDWLVKAVADFNGDGKADLALQHRTEGTLKLWLLNGTTVIDSVHFTNTLAWDLTATADTNGDGKADLILHNASAGEFQIWPLDGVTKLTTASYGDLAGWNLASTADFNADGSADMLLNNATTGESQVWLLNGSAQQASASLATLPGWDFAGATDFSADGKADLLWHNASTGVYKQWLMDGTSVALETDYSDYSGWSLMIGDDFNGDNKTDLLLRNDSSGDYQALLMDGQLVAEAAVIAAQADWDLVANQQMDLDRNADLVLRNTTDGSYKVWQMNGVSYTETVIASQPNWQVVDDSYVNSLPSVAADFNRDGKSDIVWHNTNTGTSYLWTMDGATAATKETIGTLNDTDWKIVSKGDFDGDGKADILWHHQTEGWTSVWLMDGSNILSKTSIGTLSDLDWKVAATGDFNADGRADLVWHHATQGWTNMWLMDGTTRISGNTVGTLSDTDWYIAGAGDFDGDGKSDLLWHHQTKNWTSLWFMDGDTRLRYASIGNVNYAFWKIISIGDNNGDGMSDILWHHQTNPETVLWTMNSEFALDKSSIGGVDPATWEVVHTGDYNGDGKSDFVWSEPLLGTTSLWLMDGPTPISKTSLGNVDFDVPVVNSAPVVLGNNPGVTVPEYSKRPGVSGAYSGQAFYSIKSLFSDADGDALTYSIVSGNTASAFAVDNGGNLNVANAGALNYEVSARYTLGIRAYDGKEFSGLSTVIVNLQDVDERELVAKTVGKVAPIPASFSVWTASGYRMTENHTFMGMGSEDRIDIFRSSDNYQAYVQTMGGYIARPGYEVVDMPGESSPSGGQHWIYRNWEFTQ